MTIETQSDQSCGVIYVAWGERYLSEAIASASQVKAVSGHPCVLITHAAPSCTHSFDQIITTPFFGSYRDKIAMRLSAFRKTIFLDSDTHVIGSLDPLFSLLDRFDIFFH